MNRDDELEQILYKIVEEVSKIEAPIIFCGGLALKNLLSIYSPGLNIERKTIDIDANWNDEYDEEKIINIFETAVKHVNKDYVISLYRQPSEKKSMGLKVLKNDKIVTKIDINIKKQPFYVTCKINDVNIKYSSLEKIIADKLVVVTSNHLLRRVKDLLDIYMILEENEIDMSVVRSILEYNDRKFGDSFILLNNKTMIKDSYDSLKGIVNKPSFEVVYNRVVSFLKKEKIIKDI